MGKSTLTAKSANLKTAVPGIFFCRDTRVLGKWPRIPTLHWEKRSFVYDVAVDVLQGLAQHVESRKQRVRKFLTTIIKGTKLDGELLEAYLKKFPKNLRRIFERIDRALENGNVGIAINILKKEYSILGLQAEILNTNLVFDPDAEVFKTWPQAVAGTKRGNGKDIWVNDVARTITSLDFVSSIGHELVHIIDYRAGVAFKFTWDQLQLRAIKWQLDNGDLITPMRFQERLMKYNKYLNAIRYNYPDMYEAFGGDQSYRGIK